MSPTAPPRAFFERANDPDARQPGVKLRRIWGSSRQIGLGFYLLRLVLAVLAVGMLRRLGLAGPRSRSSRDGRAMTPAKHRFYILDGMRGIAALMVMMYHSNIMPRIFGNAFVAVDFFFALSGFVIYHAYAERLQQGMSFREFVARRMGRLYPLVVVGVLLGAPLLALQLSAATGYTVRDLVAALVSNLAMLPYAKGGALNVFPGNAPLWSIAFEMLASLTFPLLLMFNNSQLRKFCITWLLVLVISAFLRGITTPGRVTFDIDGGWGPENMLGGFPRVFFSFSLEILLYRAWLAVQHRNEHAPFNANPWLLYLGLALTLMFPSVAKGLYPLVAVALLSPLLVWCGSFSTCRGERTRLVSHFLGWLSYPLYCIHWPVFKAMQHIEHKTAWAHHIGVHESLPAVALALILSVVIGLIVDWLRLQQRLTQLLSPTTGLAAIRHHYPPI